MNEQMSGKLRDGMLTAFLMLIATLTGLFFQSRGLHEANIVVLFIFSVQLIARFTNGYLFGIVGSVIGLLSFNWFFTEPYYTLKVYDVTYFITFFIMAITSVLTGALTTKVKQAAFEARERERESNALYRMTNRLTEAEDAETIARIMVTAAKEVLGCPVSCRCYEEGLSEEKFAERREAARDCLYPIRGKKSVLAELSIPAQSAEQMTQAQTRLLYSIIESASLALDRLQSLKAQAKSREEAAQERFRGNLLRAISHDLRTPLAAIMGAGEMLMDTTSQGDERYVLAEDIYRDAQWLHGMVENILNLTRLQDGRLTINKQPEVVEEVVGAAVTMMEKRLRGRLIDVDMPEEVAMAPMDAKLIHQVLTNLLDNAAKHTPPDRQICVSATEPADEIRITVADRGSGIREEDLPHIFQMFYTTGGKSPDSVRGVGLGLAICQSIVEAHGGKIWAENREGGGAAFTFTLPVR